SKLGLNIEGLGEGVSQKLLDANLVRTPKDLYSLKVAEVSQLEGMGLKSAEKLLQAIEASKQPALNRFIYALGIPGVGESTAKDLANRFKSWEAVKSQPHEGFLTVGSVGPITASSLTQYFTQEPNATEVSELAALVQPKEVLSAGGTANFVGKVFVITGTLSKPRDHYKDTIESNGGKVSSSVSKKTSYVLAGAEAGSKLDKASELGVPVLSESGFEALVNQ
ncbi:NAD-dependent DNA ligase LigA, partial [Nostoc sp. CHAB 5834]|nr:NAD-dependent DNA ligase LigA [Nostoc sp. CHAB 5834]